MIEVLNRYAHGFVAIPVVIACRKGGLFAAIESEPLTAYELTSRLGANSGHLQVALRMLESLGWIDCQADGRYFARSELSQHAQLPDDLMTLIDADMESYLRDGDGTLLQPYIDRAVKRWNATDAMLADFCDSLLAVPILTLLAKRGQLGDLVSGNFSILPAGVREEVVAVLKMLEWIEEKSGQYRLTQPGEFIFERSLNLGLAESYRPMLSAMSEILFGDAVSIFGTDDRGNELHVDRNLNVIASGFMHDRFFAEVEGMLISIFSREPVASQPRYVADMGSGDGTFLKRVYETVRDKTPRGKVLKDFPLTLIGIDLNQASLDETGKTLAGIDHVVITGDIGNPAKVREDLIAHDVDPEQVLHIRSFLDHDRPFIPPADAGALVARKDARYLGAYSDRQGTAIEPGTVVQSLVEHLDRWGEIINDHGFILLEVHCQDPLVVRQFKDQSESLYFDAIEGFSHQLLVEADAALMSAAEAGLFPRRDYFRKFPGVFPYCRITMNLFERRPYRVRMARKDDLPALLTLEEKCWAKPMRASADELLRRIDSYAIGQWVIEIDGEIAGVVYSQRVSDVASLKSARLQSVGDLFDRNGSVIQLLSLNVLPEKQNLGLGDQLLDLMIMRSALQGGVSQVAGLTRCTGFRGKTMQQLEAYIGERDAQGRPVDPVLKFHFAHGAKILEPVPGFRPEDADNLGAGILICYDFAGAGYQLTAANNDDALSVQGNGDMRSVLESCLRTVLGPARQDAFSWNKSFKDAGVDSLGLLEFRTLLEQKFGTALSPTFFFSRPTLESVFGFLDGDSQNKNASSQSSGAAISLGSSQAVDERRATRPDSVGRSSQDIAIVGMSGRFPGSPDLDAYWDLLENGRDAISEIPPSRWDVDEFYSADPDAPGKITSRCGGFLEDVALFDAAFFGVSPNEARLMDPQQRLLMEIHWEALEDAGIDAHSLKGSMCGLFVGLYGHDYEILQVQRGRVEDLGAYYATGNAASIAAGRLAYFLGTRGPALTIDTACSSSLVAVHEAVQSLRAGHSNLAIASGANLILSPRLSIIYSKAGMLSADGACKTFDESADGYVRSEGCGAVVLKRLDDAKRDNDRVLAVLRGSAINQDGASNGLTAPNLGAQEDLLQQALCDASLVPADIDYIEAHGTGTNLGDPVEFAAISSIFGDDRDRKKPLSIGSVKTNIGHTEAAAGIAGLIKVVLALGHDKMPAHLHFKKSNPLIDLPALPAQIPVKTSAWLRDDRPLRAGVSSFGFSGTNAHVIIEQVDGPSDNAVACDNSSSLLLALSAKTEVALQQLVAEYSNEFADSGRNDPANLCFTANVGRAHHDLRLAATGNSGAEIAASLRDALKRQNQERGLGRAPRVAFLFTGQGSQYIDMARALAESEPVFRESLRECQDVLGGDLSHSLEDLIYPSDSSDPNTHIRIDRTEFTQPVLFALEYSLARMFMAWGVAPCAVIGHSVGEYVAAVVAGVFSLNDGLRLITIRGRLMSALPAGGAMCALLGSRKAVLEALERHPDVDIAAYNGPENIVVSGQSDAVVRVSEDCESQGIKAVPLQVSHAFHSRFMEPILDDFGAALRKIEFHSPTVRIVSNLNGEFAGNEIMTAEYWSSHIRRPVMFEKGVESLLKSGIDVMLELGPHPILTSLGKEVEPGVQHHANPVKTKWVGALARDVSNRQSINHCLSVLYESGCHILWKAVYAGSGNSFVTAPNYPWQHEHYWFEGDSESRAATSRAAGTSRDNLVYRPVWVPKSILNLNGNGRGQPLPAPISFQSQVEIVRDRFRLNNDSSQSIEILDVICTEYITAAFIKLGWRPARGSAFSIPALMADLGIQPKYEGLVGRYCQILREDKLLEIADGGWTVAADIPSTNPAERLRSLRTHAPEFEIELRVLERCASGLADVLSGDTDPLQLIFPDGSTDDATALYTQTSFAQAGNAMVRAAMAEIVAACPDGKPLKILEIGAGTGATTASMIDILDPESTEYVFTDLSDHFLKQARRAFADYPFVRHAILDIEKDPVGQGFGSHQFDVVVAVNVLHATSDMRRTLKNVSAQMAPGAKLILIEGLIPARWLDLIFGLTDGWWKAADHVLRPDHPLLGAQAWRDLLSGFGFDDVGVFSTLDEGQQRSAPMDNFVQGLVTASMSESLVTCESAVETVPHVPTEWLFIGTKNDVVALQKLVEAHGDASEIVEVNDKLLLASPAADLLAKVSSSLCKLQSLNRGWRRQVVFLASGHDSHPDASHSQISDRLEKSAAFISQLVTLLADKAFAGSELRLVTRQARPSPGRHDLDAGNSALAALVNVGRAEHAELKIASIDFDRNSTVAEFASLLYQEVSRTDQDFRIAYQAEQRYVQRMLPLPTSICAYQCDETGTCLVLGGLGAIGMHTARWLAKRGARRIVLASRSAISGDAGDRECQAANNIDVQDARWINQSGASIRIERANVTDVNSLIALVSTIKKAGWGPVVGVIHSAATVDDKLLADLTSEMYKKVLGPKVSGGLALIEALRSEPLKFLVFHSSLGSILGIPGQGSYAVANAFVDALAINARRAGLPAVSINWCVWNDSGLAATSGGRWVTEQLSNLGVASISPGEAFQVLDQALLTAQGQLTILPYAPVRIAAADQDPLLANRDRPEEDSALVVSTSGIDQAVRVLEKLDPDERVAAIEVEVIAIAATMLNQKASDIDRDQRFGELGMDSLLGLEFRKQIQSRFGTLVSATLAWSYPTPGAVAELLSGQIDERLQATNNNNGGNQVADDPSLDAVRDISDVEALQMLQSKG